MYLLASKDTPFANLLFSKILTELHDQEWKWIKTKKELVEGLELKPNKIFFFHWSFIVPENIFSNYECIVIHTANLPEGRGGSPIQNQIMDSVILTHVNALRMGAELDAGDIYCQVPISLQGNLNDIWFAISMTSFKIIKMMTENELKAIPQASNVAGVYKRRKNNQLDFEALELNQIYDFIRMLDGNNYPKAHLNLGKYKLEFSRASYDLEKILCDVKIIENI